MAIHYKPFQMNETQPETPGKRGPSDLGNISIELPNPYVTMVLF